MQDKNSIYIHEMEAVDKAIKCVSAIYILYVT